MSSIDLLILAAAFAFCFWWTKRKAELAPGKCECGHERCAHIKGSERCVVAAWPNQCACQVFIPAGEQSDELTELRRMAGLQVRK